MASFVARVVLAVMAGLMFALYAVVLGVVAAPMLIVMALRFVSRRAPVSPVPAGPVPVLSLEDAMVRYREPEQMAA